MSSAADHYANLLAPHYTWMFGIPFADKVAEQQAVLSKAFSDTAFTPSGHAIDLGSGPGFQSFALANLGFTSVLAVDSSSTLLHELESHLAHQPVRTALADIRDLPKLTAPGSASAIVCMGDTLTHLPAKSDVATLFRDAYGALAPGGVLILNPRGGILSQPMSGGGAAPEKPKPRPVQHASISSPTPDQTFTGGEQVSASLSVEPALAPSQTVSWTLNGAQVGQTSDATQLMLPDLPRGTYTLAATVSDSVSGESISADPVTFNVVRPSLLSPQHK